MKINLNHLKNKLYGVKAESPAIKEEEVKLESLVDYEDAWRAFSEDCDRVNNLFHNDMDNTYKHVEYLNHLEQIRYHLKKILDLEEQYGEKDGFSKTENGMALRLQRLNFSIK